MRALLLLIIYFHILKINDALEDFNGHKSVLPSNAVIPEIVPPFSSNIVNGNNGIVGQSIYPNSPCQTSCNSQSTQCPSYCSQTPQLCTSGCQQQTSTKTVTVQVPVRVSKTVAENITRTVQKQPRRVKVEMETEIIKECPKNYRMIEDENDNQRCEADRTALISCPVDYEFKNNKCVRTVVTCPNEHNKIRQNCALRIVCPQSYHQQGDECVPPIPQCPYGWNWNGKICEPERLSCPTGYTLGNNNQCIHEMHRCPPYHREFGNQCIMEEPGCNYGFNINTNSHTCEKVVNKCPKGSHEQYGECINLSYECPTGSVDAGNHCTFDQTVQKLVYEIKYVPQTMTLPGPVTSNCNSYVNYGGYANYGCASPCVNNCASSL